MEEKSKKSIYIVIGIIVVIVIGLLWLLVFKKNYQDLDIASIKYSYGGGYGSKEEVANKIVTIDSDGNVELSNSYNFYVEKYNIGKELFQELDKYINERKTIIYNGVSGNDEVMDGGSSHLVVKTKDGKNYSIGGNTVNNKEYSEITDKIESVVGKDKISSYEKSYKNPKSNNLVNIESVELVEYESKTIWIKAFVNSEGVVKYTNNLDESITKEFTIEKTKFDELNNVINTNIIAFDTKVDGEEPNYGITSVIVHLDDGTTNKLENINVKTLEEKYENLLTSIEDTIDAISLSSYSIHIINLLPSE